MPKRHLLWKLYPTYIIVILFCAGAVGIYALSWVKTSYEMRTSKALQVRALLVARMIDERKDSLGTPALEDFCRSLGQQAATRITVIAPDGAVLCDSERDPSTMENHADRPEFRMALAAGSGTRTRYSTTLEADLMYYALPIVRDGKPVAVVRTAVPLTEMTTVLRSVYLRIAAGMGIVAVLAAGVGYVFSRRVSLQLAGIRDGAERFAAGDFNYSIPEGDTVEIGALAAAINRMAAELNEKLRTIGRQKSEQEAILTSMVEGVLAVDTDERVLTLNEAAAALLGHERAISAGRSLQEVARNSELERIVREALSTGESSGGEVVLHDEGERFLDVRAAALRDAAGRQMGAVVVLYDATRLKRLENVRKDFVANVSHELKTPLTSIKGFVETLRDGAASDPAQANRFLEIVSRQVDRLNAIIDDLLSLSRIESDGRERVELEESHVRATLVSAVEVCESRAVSRSVAVDVDCDPELLWTVNPALLEQAVVNLVDNAIKYSEPGTVVKVCAALDGDSLDIAVVDTGCGIDKKHLPRLFERFYRADKARSRSLGGTGLGLAIVKHIAQAHGGAVGVDSAPGKGSRFTIRLPRS